MKTTKELEQSRRQRLTRDELAREQPPLVDALTLPDQRYRLHFGPIPLEQVECTPGEPWAVLVWEVPRG